jgi:lipid A ethanolaminephosphotransferase
VYPPNSHHVGFIVSVVVILISLIVLLLTLLSSKWTTKPLLILFVLLSSATNYFMNTYHVVIDDEMIRNVLQTNISESADLFSWRLVLYLLFLGVFPAYLIYKAPVHYRSLKSELWAKTKVIFISLLLILASLFFYSKSYASFFREHKPLRFTTNPLYWIYATGKYIVLTYDNGTRVFRPMGTDAYINPDNQPLKLVIMVVGEAARADHFSLNGYPRETNPKLKKEDIINFPNFYSCGTSTAVSVPCMFSLLDRRHYSYKKGISQENVIDVLKHTGQIAILWRDNNSDSKGVALRVPYEDYKTSKHNTVCIEGECRDIGMLEGLDDFVKKHPGKHIFVVLHQMGNHGPAYYKRYPKAFEKFKPVCRTNQLEACSKEEITNAYDNAILYTDDFLSRVIAFLKKYNTHYQTAMIYMSDHGESLGENGLYLHGMPYFMAPDAQKHIGTIMWFGKNTKHHIHTEALKKISSEKFSQDNLSDTLMGLFDVKSNTYHPSKDILSQCR